MSSCYLIAGSIIQNPETRPSYSSDLLDPDMAFAKSIRDKGGFLFVSNRMNFGHLVNNEKFPVEHLNNELWEIERNRLVKIRCRFLRAQLGRGGAIS